MMSLRYRIFGGELTFTKTNENVLVDGAFETATDVQCVRSLEIFSLPLHITLESVLFTPPDQANFEPDAPGEEPERRISHDAWIDLTETLREEIILAIPINPIHPDYAGENPPPLPNGMDAAENEEDWLHIKWSNPANSPHNVADNATG